MTDARKTAPQIIVIADDITGSLDTGVMLAKRGIGTEVYRYDRLAAQAGWQSAEVVVVNTCSRHLPAEDAYRRVKQMAEAAREQDIPILYKKTDSALRGNVGSELAAAADAYGTGSVRFFPAFPRMGRTTVGGVHYINGVPVSESVFGTDPLDPVELSCVPLIIGRQTSIPCMCVDRDGDIPEEEGDQKTIFVFDGEKEEDYEKRRRQLSGRKRPLLLAGCAGFAAYLPELISTSGHRDMGRGGTGNRPAVTKKHLMVSGSFNEITGKQIRQAERAGYPVFRASREELFDGRMLTDRISVSMEEHGHVILATCEERLSAPSQEICSGLASIAGRVLEKSAALSLNRGDASLPALTVFGGDTLDAVMDVMGCRKIVPHEEAAPGVPVSTAACGAGEFLLISKSGGFGDENTAVAIIRYLDDYEREHK